jgi:ATP-dependent Clp protease ATP-binding subunit ClpC
MKEIVTLQMHEIDQRLAEHGLEVELTIKARQWLADQGYDPSFGARPLKRILQKHVESPLSVSLLSGDFKEGDKVIVDVNKEENGLEFKKK